VAREWSTRGASDRTVALLEPFFNAPHSKIDERHEAALDELLHAMLDCGMEQRREILVKQLSSHKDKVIAATAQCRWVTILSDRFEYEEAWRAFHLVMRQFPDDPQLAQLEMLLLVSQGRTAEARMRGQVLAAQLRRRGPEFADLAELILALGERGIQGAHSTLAALSELDAENDEHVAMWRSLCAHLPSKADLDSLACSSMYLEEINDSVVSNGQRSHSRTFSAKSALVKVERKWQRSFPVAKPQLTEIVGDASAVLDQLPQVIDFFKKNPIAWISFSVLDDLFLALQSLYDEGVGRAVDRSATELMLHALRCVDALLGECDHQLRWIDSRNRPMLRVIAQCIEVKQTIADSAGAHALMRRMIALNPNDNHGYRHSVVNNLRGACNDIPADAQEALTLLDRYPEDVEPAGINRALTLWMLEHHREATNAWRKSLDQAPAFGRSLLAPSMDAPPESAQIYRAFNGEAAAFDYRTEMRHLWLRSGAMAWAQSLPAPQLENPSKIPKGTATKPRKEVAKPKAAATSIAPVSAIARSPKSETSNDASVPPKVTMSAKAFKTLRSKFPDYHRLHGFVSGICWAPDWVAPNAWITVVLDMHVNTQDARAATEIDFEALNADLAAVMSLYNTLNFNVRAHTSAQTAPPDFPPALNSKRGGDHILAGTEDRVFAWAAGFMQASELAAPSWRRLGVTHYAATSAFAPIKSLAARAPLMASKATPNWHVTADGNQPFLVGLDDKALAPTVALDSALLILWRHRLAAVRP
jgi:tetratricopeptide (TPR) repeat protein